MALRELFTEFFFAFDRGSLRAVERASTAAEERVKKLSRAVEQIPASPALKRITSAMQEAGTSSGGAATALRGLRAQVDAAAAGDERLAAAFAELGVDLQRVSARGRHISTVWSEIVGRLSAVENQAKRTRLAMSLLGEHGAAVAAPAIAKGPQALRIERRLAMVVEPKQPPPPTGIRAWTAALRESLVANRAARLASDSTTDSVKRQSRSLHEAGQEARWYRQQLQSPGMVGSLLQSAFWEGLARSIMHATTQAARYVGQLALAGGKLVVETALWADATKKGIGALSGFADVSLQVRRGGAEFEAARRTALKLALPIQDTIDAYKQLRAVGFSAQEALDTTRLTADLKAGIGLTNDQIKRVLLAFTQIKGAGVLQGDELRQLQETGINVNLVWESIAAQMGVTVQEAKKLKEQAKVSADVALKAVQQATLQTLGTAKPGEAAVKLSTSTLRGQLQTARNQIQNWLLDLSDELTPEFEKLATTVGASFSSREMQAGLARLSDSVRRFLTDLTQLVDIHWEQISRIIVKVTGKSAEGIDSATMRIDKTIKVILDAIEALVDHLPEVVKAFKIASVIVVGALTAIGISAVINAVKTTVALVAAAWSTAAAWSQSSIVTTLIAIGRAGVVAAWRVLGAMLLAARTSGAAWGATLLTTMVAIGRAGLAAAVKIGTAMVTAAKASGVAWGAVAVTVGAVAAAVASVLIAIDQAIKLYKEIDGDLSNITKDYTAREDRDPEYAAKRKREQLDRWSKVQAKASGAARPATPTPAPVTPEVVPVLKTAPTAPATMPMPDLQADLQALVSSLNTGNVVVKLPPGEAAKKEVTLNDHRRVEVNVAASASPAAVGRQVAEAVTIAQRQDYSGLNAALVGAVQQ